MSVDLRLAWLLTRGSDRREWWRAGLTAVGAVFATGVGLAIAAIAPLRGQYHVPLASGLLNQPGTRAGVVMTLALLFLPILGFLGQCARIGAVHRDRRLAALRLAGAAPGQVRRIAALESGLACLAGSVLATVGCVPVLLSQWQRPPVLAWAGIALVAVAVPVLGASVSVLSLRRVVASPLGRVRRVRPTRGPGWVFGLVTGLLAGLAVLIAATPYLTDRLGFAFVPLAVCVLALLTGAAALWLAGWSSRRLGGVLAARAQSPALLIAAERLRDDPWAASRTHAAVLLVTVVGSGFVGVRAVLIDTLREIRREDQLARDMAYYTTGLDLTGAAILVAFALVLAALAVGTAESLATRRRGLAAQTAAGVPGSVLRRALLLETALPLAPAVVLAGAGGVAITAWYAALTSQQMPYVVLLVPVVVYGACLLAAATSLPLLGRSVRPAELRYA
ncbi:ABC transporter permease [Streptomyces lanatus]|uniref:ABC transporter permease n=1 Tax=Streptomyces lanatus TaxID=66900 RepID=A0ABV1XI25_9ACTN|nr:ABC transporter permease [Streptomyces lanatus]